MTIFIQKLLKIYSNKKNIILVANISNNQIDSMKKMSKFKVF